MEQNDFEILEQKGDIILSIKRLPDGVIFKVGDVVDLNFHVKDGMYSGYTIESFQNKEGGNKHFPNATFSKGTIVTKHGCMNISYATHVDYKDEMYILHHTDILSMSDIFQIFGRKKPKVLLNLVKKKLNDKDNMAH